MSERCKFPFITKSQNNKNFEVLNVRFTILFLLNRNIMDTAVNGNIISFVDLGSLAKI